jgi:hypothetical protein
MGIDDFDAPDQIERFRSRVSGRLAEHGQLADLALGEAFRLMKDL